MIGEKEFDENSPLESAPDPEGVNADDSIGMAGTIGLPMEPVQEAVRRAEGQLRDSQEKYLRLAAEYDNFRKRIARERVELADRAQANVVMRLVDVMDDLDRLVATTPETSGQVLHEGMVLVDKKLRKELETLGLERLDPAGSSFDPSLHEAVSVLPTDDPAQDHFVSATFQAGYRFKGNLVRPARVQVYSTQGHA